MNIFDQYRGLKREIYILFIGRIVTRFGSMVWSMLTLILNQKLGYTASQISIFMIIFNITSVLMSLIGGKMADRFNKKNLIIFFDLISIVLYLICSFIDLSNLTIALIVIAASSQWAESPSYDALISDLTLTKDRERAYALQYLGTNIGLMLAPTLAGFLFKKHLSMLFSICGLSILISTILIFFKIKDITPIVEKDKVLQMRRDGDSLFKILKGNKLLILFFLCMGLYSSAYGQYTYLMPLDMGKLYGENGALIYGTFSSLNCFVVVIFSPLVLKLCKGIEPLKKIRLAQVFVVSGFVLFLFFMKFLPISYVAVILFTFGEIFATMGDSPYISSRIPGSHRGRIKGFSLLVYNVMDSVLLYIEGRVYESKTSESAWLLVIFVVITAIILTTILIKEDRKKYENT